MPNPCHSRPSRVLVVDDHPLFRKGVATIIRDSQLFDVCADAGNAKEALGLLRSEQPDLVLMDISMPGHNGVELLKMMRGEYPEIPIIILTVHDETVYAIRALKAGARGYLLKGEPVEEIVHAMTNVLAGELYLSGAIKHQLIFQAIEALDTGKESLIKRLTRREKQVFDLLSDGLASQAIAEKMGLSVKTIDTHRIHIKEKLYCADAAEVSKFAEEWKLYCESDDSTARVGQEAEIS